jgi:hypothetical protein
MSEIEIAITGDNAPERQVTGPSRLDRVNRWLTLAANLGVMFGLIVLIFEVQQSANLARVALETERSDAAMVIELRMTDPAVAAVWEKSIYAPSDLTTSELRIMDGILASYMMNYDRLLLMMDGKLVDRARLKQNIENTAPWILGSAFGKNWWRQNAVGWQGTPLYEIADPIIAEVPDDFLANYYASLQLAPPAALEAK